MEQLYLLEIFVDTAKILDEDNTGGKNKNLIIIFHIAFGPRIQMIFKQGQIAVNSKISKNNVKDEDGTFKWIRTFRIGQSYLFTSDKDSMVDAMEKNPLLVEAWTDYKNEAPELVGYGRMIWDSQFFVMMMDSMQTCETHKPLTLKRVQPLYAECCCKQVGEVHFIVRISALGDSIVTDFRQRNIDGDEFLFRTDKAPSKFLCTEIEESEEYTKKNGVYEQAMNCKINQPIPNRIEVCSKLHSCQDTIAKDIACKIEQVKKEKVYPVDKVRMGDIVGPCGNVNCGLARKVRTYIRGLSEYKKEAQGKVSGTKPPTKKICGTCVCKDDTYHRETCPDKKLKDHLKAIDAQCKGCDAKQNICENTGELKKKALGKAHQKPADKGASSPNKTNDVLYCVDLQRDEELLTALFGREIIMENLTSHKKPSVSRSDSTTSLPGDCSCSEAHDVVNDSMYENKDTELRDTASAPISVDSMISSMKFGPRNIFMYNVAEMKMNNSNRVAASFCTDIPEKNDCTCSPPKPTPPCKANDCVCVTKAMDIDLRKRHKSYCPRFKHKPTCAVVLKTAKEEDDREDHAAEEDVTEPLPYGLPPVKLGPCPVLGKPCTYPDGFARMYKAAVLPPAQKSYDDAGKICCTTEFERIKKALKEYMTNDKEDDYRCINKFNVDTERRCCDKENKLLPLIGKACCGYHKMALQERYKSSGPKAGDKKQ